MMIEKRKMERERTVSQATENNTSNLTTKPKRAKLLTPLKRIYDYTISLSINF